MTVAEVRHEARDASFRQIIVINLIIFAILIVLLVLLVVFYMQKPPLHALHLEAQPPPHFSAEHYPMTQKESILPAKKQWLSSYGWVDQQKGIAHIPIERAMELVAEGR